MPPISHENSLSSIWQWLCENIDSFQLWTDHMLKDCVDFHNALGNTHFDHTELIKL